MQLRFEFTDNLRIDDEGFCLPGRSIQGRGDAGLMFEV